MRYRKFFNRVERREFDFDAADIEKALIAAVAGASYSVDKPEQAIAQTWALDWNTDGANGALRITLMQQFEYLDEPKDQAKTESR